LILTKGRVLILHGRDSSATPKALDLPFSVQSAAIGRFVLDPDHRLQLALLAADGTLYIYAGGNAGKQPGPQPGRMWRGRSAGTPDSYLVDTSDAIQIGSQALGPSHDGRLLTVNDLEDYRTICSCSVPIHLM
jgi:hypothetical protein